MLLEAVADTTDSTPSTAATATATGKGGLTDSALRGFVAKGKAYKVSNKATLSKGREKAGLVQSEPDALVVVVVDLILSLTRIAKTWSSFLTGLYR